MIFHFFFQCDVPEGGLVPKSLYKEDYIDRSPDDPPLHLGDSLYMTAHVVKDYPHEVGQLPGSSEPQIFSVQYQSQFVYFNADQILLNSIIRS